MAIIQNERLHDVLHNSLWMSYSEVQPLLDTSTIPDRGSVAYISGFMERFVRSENLFTPDGFDTLTQKFVALRKKDKSFYNREVADFALFLSGMNPERLKKKGYWNNFLFMALYTVFFPDLSGAGGKLPALRCRHHKCT